MIISTPDPVHAQGAAAAMYSADLDEDGMVYSHTRAMAVNPEAYAAFEDLVHAIVPSIGVHIYEAATLGAARAIGSPHCLLAHGRRALRVGVVTESGLQSFAEGDDRGFTEAEQAVIRFATRLSTSPSAMTDADAAELRDLGFSDRQIVDITLAAAARNYLSRALLALAVPLDEVPGIPPRLADSLAGAASPDVGGPRTANR